MSIKSNHLLRAVSLLVLLALSFPANNVNALASSAPPPVDMFQLPWDQGIAWMAIDGIDNGSKRPASSSHNFRLGGALDFAPHSNMVTGENTSNFWVTAAAAGTVIATSTCYVTIAHANGWITQYQFLGNIQVKLGDAVARNQRLAIIADGVRLKYCPGFQDINVPHLHFMLRPSIIGASFAGWEVKYNSFFNNTSFTKNGNTVGLFKPLLNTFGSTVTPTPGTSTPQITGTPSTPTAQITGTPATSTNQPSATPTISGPFVSTTIAPQSISIGESALVTVRLNNVPAEGYTSTEFTCTYNANLFEISNITIASLFGADPVAAINGPQAQSLIVAIAASDSNKATTSGTAFTFNVKGLQAGQSVIECRARVSQGNNVLTEISFAVDSITILAGTATPSLTPTVTQAPASVTPSPAPAECDQAAFIADVNVPPGTIFAPGTQFTKTWRLQNIGTCTWTTAYQLVFFSGDQMSAVSSASFPISVAPGQTADFSLNMTAPLVTGSYQGNWMLKNANGALFGIGTAANEPFAVSIVVAASTATPSVATVTPQPGWTIFTNSKYGFQLQYPSAGQLLAGNTDTYARIDLPFAQGTNLRHKYLEVVVAENANPCESPFASGGTPAPPETVVLNGIPFLKQTASEGAAGNQYHWVAFSTSRNNVCVSLDFMLHSLGVGAFPTPQPLEYDFALESAVFEQIASTYVWLAVTATSTPTPASVATNSPAPTLTSTPMAVDSPTPVLTASRTSTLPPSGQNGAITGVITASKPVVVNVYDSNTILVATVQTNPDGTFHLEVPAGNYTVVASAPGFLRAQAAVPSLNPGVTRILPSITLAAGDIDGNDVIDQFDALTLGMAYNSSTPAAADLNSDGIINVLDLEALAKNYRKTGPVAWQ